jgi:ABC-type multidrug transport system fused ATPase/permease subunit
MKFFFRALLRVKNHTLLFVSSLLSLTFLTLFNQLEVMAFGAVAKTGSPSTEMKNEKLSKLITLAQDALGLNLGSFKTIVFVFLFIGLCKAVFLFMNKYLTKILAVRICRDLRNQCFAHIQTLPLSFFSTYDRGKLSTRVITDANQISVSLNSFVTNYIHMPLVVISTLSICLLLSWKLTLLIFLAGPAIILPLKWITKKIRKVAFSMQRRQESFTSVIIDHLSGIFTIKSYQLENYSKGKYEHENARMVFFDERVGKYDMMTRPITHFVMTCLLLSIFGVGMHVLELTFPDMIVYCGVLHMLYGPFKQFSEENASVQKGVVAATRLFDIMEEPSEDKAEHKEAISKFSHSIIFDNVTFSYLEQPVLENISFEINKGDVLAITGSTGSGKSTLLKLFSKLYEVDSGVILIDGRDINDTKLTSLRNQFALVAQEPFFFNDTVRANLIFNEDIKEEKMIEMAKKACIHEFIISLESGYDTIIEEMGKNLSGGQKQRLALARALLRNAPVLLLDEATSSLDAVSESLISKGLSDLKGEVTQIIVAHRLSTIQHADKILFLEHGKIKAFGTLNEVMVKAPAFAAMWEASKLEPMVN